MKFRNMARALYWSLPDKITNNIQSLRDEGCSEKKIYRSYFDETKSIFIHIPKVAGKSISYALYGDDPKHHKLSSFELLNKEKYEQYFKFGFVRNPWSRLYSTYNYLVKQNNEYPYGKFHWISQYNTFEKFVILGLNEEIINKYLFLNTQFSYLSNSSGVIGVDFVGKLESINKDFLTVVEKVGSIGELKVIGASQDQVGYREVYSNLTREKVEKLYCNDIEEFGYEF